MSCGIQLPKGSWERTREKAEGRGRRASWAGSSVAGLMPGGRVEELPRTVADDACEDGEIL